MFLTSDFFLFRHRVYIYLFKMWLSPRDMSRSWDVARPFCPFRSHLWPKSPPLLMHSFPLCSLRAFPCLSAWLPVTAISLKLEKGKCLAFRSINVFSVSNYSGAKCNPNLEDLSLKCNTWVLTWVCWGASVDLGHEKPRQENIKFEFKVTVELCSKTKSQNRNNSIFSEAQFLQSCNYYARRGECTLLVIQ